MKDQISECLSKKDSFLCQNLKEFVATNGTLDAWTHAGQCLANATGNGDFNSNRDEYLQLRMDMEPKSNPKLCDYRYLHSVSDFSIATKFNQSSACFAFGPKDADTKVTNCYKKVFESLTINYDKDYILCSLFDAAIRKVFIGAHT